jgi:hypothetical protein
VVHSALRGGSHIAARHSITPLARPAAAKVHGAAEAGVPKDVSTIAESGTAALFTAK